ncbi:MAG: hypothetical protein ACXWVD_00230 [Telluria sp.]
MIETSELNKGRALRESNAGYTGGSGDGNDLPLADLKQGYTDLTERVPPNDGFLNRPMGWER